MIRMAGTLMERTLSAASYAERVVELLAPRFPDLEEEIVARLAVEHITRHALDPQPTFEFLLTGSGTARLKPHRDLPGRLRLADYGFCPSPERTAEFDALNDRLDGLDEL